LLWKKAYWEDSGGTGRLRLDELYTKIRTYHPEWNLFNVHDPGITRALITGALELDGAILVVSAVDGIEPQIREHVLLARQVGVPALVVFIDDTDLVTDPAVLQQVALEIRELLVQNGYDGDHTPIIQGSAAAALGGEPGAQAALVELVDALDAFIPDPIKKADKPFWMPVEDVLSIDGRGVVAIGCIEAGRIAVGDHVEVVGFFPTAKPSTVHQILIIAEDVEGEALAAESSDECIGLILGGVDANDLEPGQVIAKPGLFEPKVRFEALVYVLEDEEGGAGKPFFSHYRPQFYFRGPTISGEVGLPAVDFLFPGDAGVVEVELQTYTALMQGQRFAVRDGDRTVGAGQVLNVLSDSR